MKLTETKLKQIIKEMMTSGQLVHNGKPALSENGRKIEEMLMSRDAKFIYQAESLLDALSSVLDPLEADYLDALSKAAVATANLRQISREESERYKIHRNHRPERNSDYGRIHTTSTNDFRDAYERIRRIVGEEEAKRIHRNLQAIVA